MPNQGSTGQGDGAAGADEISGAQPAAAAAASAEPKQEEAQETSGPKGPSGPSKRGRVQLRGQRRPMQMQNRGVV